MDFIAAIERAFAGLGQFQFQPERLLSSMQYISAFIIAFSFFALRSGWKRRRRWRVVLRAMFRKSQWLNRSTFVDSCYILANAVLVGGLITTAALTSHGIYVRVYEQLIALGGAPSPTRLSPQTVTAIMMVLAYIGYEFGYYIDHYLSHKVRFLWEFHKVHHSATVLTPLTNYRVHPVDSIVFFNIIAIVIGSMQAVAGYLLGSDEAATFFPENYFLLAYFYLYAHLQHTHIWMPFTGLAGHIFCSPAHHQIHHSMQSRHFDKNFGSSLVVFDWLFGTLWVPSKEREVTSVGVQGDRHLQSYIPSLVMPFFTAAPHLLPASLRRKKRSS